MQTVSALYQTLLALPTTRKEVRVRIDTLPSASSTTPVLRTFSEGDLFEVTTAGSLFASETLSFGGCVSRTITVRLNPTDAIIPRMARIIPSVRLLNGSRASEWIPKGVFYIDTRETDRSTGILTLTGYDAMLKAEADYIGTGDVGEWPRTMDSVASEIAGMMGVTIDSRTGLEGGYMMELPSGYTMREILGYIAAANAGNWIMTDEGKLRMIRAEEEADTCTLGGAARDLKLASPFDAITHVIVNCDEEVYLEAGDDTGRTLEVTCPWGTQAMANEILAELSGFVYQPFTASGAILDPAAEIGDQIILGEVSGILADQSTRFDSLFSSDIGSPGEDEIDHEYPYKSTSSREINRRLKTINTTFRVETERISGEITDMNGRMTALNVSIEGVSSHVEAVEEAAVSSVRVYYALSTSESTAPSTGWSTVAPAWENGKYMWQKTVTTYGDGTTSESSPTCISGARGVSPEAGYSTAIVYLYKRSSTPITAITWSNTLTYNFASHSLTSVPSGWSQTIPSGNAPLYVTGATAYSNNGSDTIAASEWTSPVLLVKNGEDGSGIQSVTVTYGVSASPSTTPSSWQSTLPTAPDGQYLWTRTITDYVDPNLPDSVTYTYAKQGEDGERGEAGTSITVSSILYQSGTSATTPPTGTWKTTPVSVAQGQYLWTKTTFSDGSIAYGVARQGADGAAGTGISSVSVSYSLSAASPSSVDPASLTWQSTLPTVPNGSYLWVRTITDYSDPNVDDTITYTYSRQGENGTAGTSVTITAIQYQAGSSATTAPTGTWSSSPVSAGQGKYLWTRTTFSDGTTAYSVAYQGINGTNGTNGTNGRDGTNGTSSYIHIRYADVPNPTNAQMKTTPSAYIGLCVNTSSADPTTASSYTWSRWEGEDGPQGIPGTNGKDGTSEYVHFAYSTTADGTGNFSTSPFTGAVYLGVCHDDKTADPTTPASYEWSLIKGEDGQNGLNVASVFLYQRAADVPTKPSVDTNYTFSTGKLSGYTSTITADELVSGVWVGRRGIPSPPNGRTQELIRVTAGTTVTYTVVGYDVCFDVLATPQDSTYCQLNGWKTTSGSVLIRRDGFMTFSIRKHGGTSDPISPWEWDGTVTIDHVGGVEGWVQEIPPTYSGLPCYVCQATASSRTATDTIAASEWSAPVLMLENGVGVNSVTVSYASTATAPASVDPTTLTWESTIPSVAAGSYLWTRTITDYTDSSVPDTVSYSYAKQGSTGAKGDTGETGSSVTVSSIQYQAGTSATTAPTGTWSNSPVSVSAGQYLWTRTTFSDGSVAYGVARQGVNGDKGDQGDPGANGYNTAVVYLYKRSASVPSVDWSDALTYNFTGPNAHHLSVIPQGWSESMPPSDEQAVPLSFTIDLPRYVVYNTGSAASSENYSCTNYIECGAYKKLKYRRCKSVNSNPSVGIAFYSDKSTSAYISGVQCYTSQDGMGYGDWLDELVVPEGANYIRCSTYTDTSTYGSFEIYGVVPLPVSNPVYVTVATAYSNTGSDSIATTEWSTPVKMIEDGSPGLNSATAFLYQRSDTVPAKPLSDSTYTFAKGELYAYKSSITPADLVQGQWSYSTPDSRLTRARTSELIYVKTGTVITYTVSTYDVYFGVLETPTDSSYIQFIGWKTASGSVTVTNDGWMTFLIRNHSDTSANVTPSAWDGTVTIKHTGWSQVIPDSDGNPCYVTQATAANTAATDTISVSEWSDPTIMTENGVGVTKVVPYYYLSTSSASAAGGTWSTTPPEWEEGKYIWTRSRTYYTDGTSTYSTAVLDRATNGMGQKYTDVKQEADKISWIVSGDAEATFTLTERAASLVAGAIDLTGYVTFNSLSTPGSTTIDGGNITTGTIDASSVTITNLSASSITTGTMSAARISGGTIDATNVTITKINASNITSGNLSATRISGGTFDGSKMTVTNLSASSITSGTLDASKVTVSNLDASSITTGTLSADRISGGTINANSITVSNLSASNINRGTLNASVVPVTNMNASNLTNGSIDASVITITKLNASNITTGTLDASKVTVSNLSASVITTGTLDASKVTVSNLSASSITTGSMSAARITSGTMSAARISGGTINASTTTITNINASNITTGTLSADRIDATSLKIQELYAVISSATYSVLWGSSDNLYIGKAKSGTGSLGVDEIFLHSNKTHIGWGSTSSLVVFDHANAVFRPTGSYSLGTATYPWANAYVTTLYLNGTQVTSIVGTTDVKEIYCASSTSNKIALSSAKDFVPSGTGFSLGSSSYPFDEVYVGTGSVYYWTMTAASLLPSSSVTASSSYFDLGSSARPVNKVYANEVYIGGTKVGSGGDFAGSEVKMGGTASYYIVANTSRHLRPYSTSTSYPCYLGTSTYYWHYAYLGSNTVMLGSATTSKIGFYGTTAIAKQTLSLTSNNMSYTSVTDANYLYALNNLIGILKNKLGLIA